MENNACTFYKEKLDILKQDMQYRQIRNIVQDGKRVILDGKMLLNFSSNDYLGISSDSNITDNFLSSYKGKISNPSARLLSGTNKVFEELEEIISYTLRKEKTLLFNSGYHANVGIYSSLVSANDAVFIDKLNHASIIDGIHLSKADIIPYKHLNYDDLRLKLAKYRKKYNKVIISSESLFSMDGDIADIKTLCLLKKEFDTLLIIDEAHSFGVYGEGKGLCFEQNIFNEVDLIMATFGKSIGSYGAFAAGSRVLVDYLINYARSFIFSTSLPEISVSFSKYVLQNEVLNTNKRQKELFSLTDYFHKSVNKLNVLGESYIVPIIAGSNENALLISDMLIKNGFYILPIRYPTVKKGDARVRISLNPSFNVDEINKLASLLLSWKHSEEDISRESPKWL